MNRLDFQQWLNSWPGDECRVELHRNVWGRYELRAVNMGNIITFPKSEHILELRVNEGEGERRCGGKET